MQLRNKVTRFDHLDKLIGRHEFDADAGFGHEVVVALAGLDKEGVNAVAEPSAAWRRDAERMDRTRRIAGLFKQFAPAAFGNILSRLGKACRKLPGEAFESGPVLVNDRKLPAWGQRDDGEIIL